jgi:tol-pal system protein YbgF
MSSFCREAEAIMKVSRMRAFGALLVAAALLGGCATKKDVRTLQEQMRSVQQQQSAMLRDIQQQNRLLLDSIRATMSLTQDVRGSTSGQLRGFEQNVTQLGNLMSQVMGTLTRIEQRLTELEQKSAQPANMAAGGGGSAEEYYNEGQNRYISGNYGAARILFEQLVNEYPTHAQAPDAQYFIAETYVQEKNYPKAYQEFEAVAKTWKDAPRAREALMRAGVVAQEQRDNARARTYYTRVRDEYKGTDEAAEAVKKLSALPRR